MTEQSSFSKTLYILTFQNIKKIFHTVNCSDSKNISDEYFVENVLHSIHTNHPNVDLTYYRVIKLKNNTSVILDQQIFLLDPSVVENKPVFSNEPPIFSGICEHLINEKLSLMDDKIKEYKDVKSNYGFAEDHLERFEKNCDDLKNELVDRKNEIAPKAFKNRSDSLKMIIDIAKMKKNEIKSFLDDVHQQIEKIVRAFMIPRHEEQKKRDNEHEMKQSSNPFYYDNKVEMNDQEKLENLNAQVEELTKSLEKEKETVNRQNSIIENKQALISKLTSEIENKDSEISMLTTQLNNYKEGFKVLQKKLNP